MEGSASDSRLGTFAHKALAVVILLIAAWIVIKVVVGVVAFLFWAIVIVLGIAAVIWALRVLL